MNQPKTYKVFIASPRDVNEEREIALQVIQDINRDLETEGAGYSLEPRTWEKTYPDIGKAQSVINKQIPIEESDIFVGIFWYWFGKPPGLSQRKGAKSYLSGTEFEIDKAFRARKKNNDSQRPVIMLYRKMDPLPVSMTDDEYLQFPRVIEFFKQCESIGKHPSQVARFQKNDFYTILKDHLILALKNLRSIDLEKTTAREKQSPRSNKNASKQTLPTIGIITALPKEYAAMESLLLNRARQDISSARAISRYSLGDIPASNGTHRIVLALSGMGNNQAATCATLLLERHKSIQWVIMVGIAGGIPNPSKADEHVRLGDIVVSNEQGVIQYDFDKETANEIIIRTPPRPASSTLLKAVSFLEIEERKGNKPWFKHIKSIQKKLKIERPADRTDILVASSDPNTRIVHPKDPFRQRKQPRVFSGPIASANKLLKNPLKRDALRDKFGVKAVEMESSGLVEAAWGQEIGYLAIRGICDYCDSNKNDAWQGYAAAVAAGYTRALLESLKAFPPASEDSQGINTLPFINHHPKVSDSPFYANWPDMVGLKSNPFQSINATNEDNLASYFVKTTRLNGIDLRDLIQSKIPWLIFGELGTGKTALRKILRQYCFPSDKKSATLNLEYDRALLEQTLQKAEGDVAKIDTIYCAETISHFVSSTLNLSRSTPIASKDAYSLMKATSEAIANSQFNNLLCSVDELDDVATLRGKPDNILKYLEAITRLPAFENITVNTFLPLSLEKEVYKNHKVFRPDHYHLLTLDWSEADIGKLIKERMMAFSKDDLASHTSLGELCEGYWEQPVDVEIANLAELNPRAAMWLARQLIETHRLLGSSLMINPATWEQVKIYWGSTGRSTVLGPNAIHHGYWHRGTHIFYQDKAVNLTKHSQALLSRLIKAEGIVCTKLQLVRAGWPEDNPEGVSGGALAEAMRRLKKELKSQGLPANCIESKRGQGYRLTRYDA